jgi:signal transduction histidine kinase
VSESPGLPVTVSVLACIGALTAATIWGEAGGDTSSALLILDVAAGLAALALLPVLLRWPVPGAIALAVLAALSPAATPAATYATLHVALRRPFAVAAAVGAAGVVAHLIRGLWRPIGSLPYGWWAVLVIVAEAALVGWGQLSRARQALLASLRERACRAETEQARHVAEARAAERASIAREMHDVLAHRLSLLATYAGALEYRPDAPPEQLARAAGVVRASTHQALDELREVISVLRDDDSTAGIRPQPGLADLSGLVVEARDAGTPVDLADRISRAQDLPGALGRTAYRIAQEGLTNARKHAPGQPVRLLLNGRPGDQLLVELTNPAGLPAAPRPATPAASGARDESARDESARDDSALDDSALAALATPVRPSLNGSGTGTGLIGLTERARLAGGELDHGIGPDGQFRLRARLPWPAGATEPAESPEKTKPAETAGIIRPAEHPDRTEPGSRQ